jgi:type II secretory pathway pseudopilin PulG
MRVRHPQFEIRTACRGNQGYILITLILLVALLAIAMTAMAPVIKQQVKRDREEELIHRGVQYSRAIKHFVKKFGRYPTKLEDLENTNNIRFLRKRYKDPITGKDFKILHMGEVQMSFGGGIAGATSAASLATASQGGAGGFGNSASGGGSSFGGSSFGGSSGSSFGGSSFGGGNSAGSNFGGSSFGGSSFGSGNSTQSSGNNQTQGNPQANPDQDQGTDASNPDQKVNGQQPGQTDANGNPVFGGGPIVGVASTSKDKTIRVFNKKEHYYQWQFIYDPSTDTGGLLSTPNQPGLQSVAGGMQQGVPGQPGTQNSPFGTQGPGFGGQGSSFGNQGSFGFQGGNQPAVGSQPMQPQPLQPQMPPDQAPPQ